MKKIFFFGMCIIGSLSSINCAFAGRHNQWKYYEEQWKPYKGKNRSQESNERKRQHQNWVTIEEFTHKQQAKAPTKIQFHPEAHIEDPQYQIFMVMLLMSSYALQVNATVHKQALSSPNFQNSEDLFLQRPQLVRNTTLPVCSINEALKQQPLSNTLLSSSPSKANIGAHLPSSLKNTKPALFSEAYGSLPKATHPKVAAKKRTKSLNKKQASTNFPSALHNDPTDQP